MRLACPGVACQNTDGLERQDVLQSSAKFGQHLLQHPAHGEHGGSGIHAHAVDLHLPNLAPWGVGSFDQRDSQAAMGQHQGAAQAANARAHHDHAA